MKRVIVLKIFLIVFNLKAISQYSFLEPLGMVFHAGVNAGLDSDIGYLKINDFITDDTYKINQFSLKYGANVKLFIRGLGVSSGFSIGKSLPFLSAEMVSTKYNIGLNWYNHAYYESCQFSLNFNWSKRNYFFEDYSLMVPSNFSSTNQMFTNGVRFIQRSINWAAAIPLNPKQGLTNRNDSQSPYYRFLVGLEWVLPTSKWVIGNSSIDAYQNKTYFLVSIGVQMDFGKYKPKSRWGH